MKYIPSVAYSLCDYRADADFSPLTPYVRQFTQQVLDHGLPRGVCLNINFPLLHESGEYSNYRGVRICRMAYGTWGNEVTKFRHPRGYDYWWMVGFYTNDEPEAEDTDNWALQHGFIAITPTRMDVTAYEAMDSLKSVFNL
jgi:5'-nucleotidase